MMYNEKMLESFSKEYAERCQVTDKITAEMFDANGVLRGLRDKNGNGVVAGLTNISKIEAFRMENGQKIPCDGNLWYRGYNVIDLVKGFEGKRCGFEEVAYLLLFGELPSGEQLHNFCEALATALASADKFYERCHYESTECRSDEFPDQKCTDTGIL